MIETIIVTVAILFYAILSKPMVKCWANSRKITAKKKAELCMKK